jgi:flagellin
MGLSINTNIAATRSSMYLATNHANLQKSLDRLSSGKRITEPADDAGGLAVSMKLDHSSKVLRGVTHNISNGISLLQVQDGILASAGDIVSRMGELKAMHSDVTKNAADRATYDSEFQDLQGQLFNLASTEFNGIRVIGDLNDATTGVGSAATPSALAFGNAANMSAAGVTLNVSTTEDGAAGPQVVVQQSLLLSAVTLTVANAGNVGGTEGFTSAAWDVGANANTGGGAGLGLLNTALTLADDNPGADNLLSLDNITAGFFTQALQNVATLRANNGGQVRHLQYAHANAETQITNLTAANGRIVDVDIAQESSNLARQQVLVQASAAMTAQANVANDVALMLLQ